MNEERTLGMPQRNRGLERREQTARHELTVVMEETTLCRERQEITQSMLRRWLRHLNRASHLLLSDLEREIDNSLPESAWLWTAIDDTLAVSREIVALRHRIIAGGDLGELSAGLYEEMNVDAALRSVQELVSRVLSLIPREADGMPEAYGEG